MSPHWRKRLFAILFFAAIAAWVITARTVFKDEPQGILGLSWLAIIIEVGNAWQHADVRKQQEGGDG